MNRSIVSSIFQCPLRYHCYNTTSAIVYNGVWRRFYSSQTAPELTTLKYEKRETKNPGKHIGIVSFNRQKQLNAIDSTSAKEFSDLITNHIAKDSSVAALVLTGEGDKAFSAGGDYDFLLERCRDKPYNNTQQMLSFYASFLHPLLSHLKIPTIAAINGFAIGAGLCVAMACDIRVTCPEAKMGVTFSQLGLHPGMGSTHLLPHLLNHQIASYLLLTGDVIDGTKAKELGIVLETVPKETVKNRAIEIAEKIAVHPSLPIHTVTKTLRVQLLQDLDRQLMREADAQAQCYATDEMYQIVTGMKEKLTKK
eukprot:TRINITY_DN5657_c0_g1_i1.p1 TRINITY_DN5657_c0_g1~~TRINITY_DN5657_c0_g1_i1.p1  ORF type:complete len:309 (-),score=77.67 TRINITY_DN5657_c0_g1_i1:71-997(-)